MSQYRWNWVQFHEMANINTSTQLKTIKILNLVLLMPQAKMMPKNIKMYVAITATEKGILLKIVRKQRNHRLMEPMQMNLQHRSLIL